MSEPKKPISLLHLALGPVVAVLVVCIAMWYFILAPKAAGLIYNEAKYQLATYIPLAIAERSQFTSYCSIDTVQKKDIVGPGLDAETPWDGVWDIESNYDLAEVRYPLTGAPNPSAVGEKLMKVLREQPRPIASSLRGDVLVVEYPCGRGW